MEQQIAHAIGWVVIALACAFAFRVRNKKFNLDEIYGIFGVFFASLIFGALLLNV